MKSMYAVADAEYGKKADKILLFDTLSESVSYCVNEVHNALSALDDRELYIIEIESGTVIYVYRVHNNAEFVDTINRKIFITCEELGIDYQALKCVAGW